MLCTPFLIILLLLGDQVFDRSTAHEVSTCYQRTTFWTPCVVLDGFKEALEAEHTLNSGTVWAHPHFTSYHVEAQYALAELLSVQA